MNDDQRIQVQRLLREQRWAALATRGEDGSPSVGFVAFVAEPGLEGFLLHVSRLAEHTRNLLVRPAVALGISDTDDGRADPQLLARMCIHCSASVIQRGTTDYLASRKRYLEKLPLTEQLFGFEDFVLARLHPQEARYVGGFARTFHFTAEQLRQIATL